MPKTRVDRIGIFYEIQGDDHSGTVALLNGVMSSARAWEPQAAVLRNAGFRVLLHDFRGQLLSEKPDHAYSFSQHAADFKELLDQQGITSVHVAGISYGGIVAMQFAADYPEMVKSLVLMNTFSEVTPLIRWTVDQWIEPARDGDILKLYDILVPFIYSNTYLENHMDAVLERRRMLKMVPNDFLEGLVRLFENVRETNITHRLPEIRCPSLVVSCGEDILTPGPCADNIAKLIPNSEKLAIPDCGHASFYEKPALIASVILGFISSAMAI